MYFHFIVHDIFPIIILVGMDSIKYIIHKRKVSYTEGNSNMQIESKGNEYAFDLNITKQPFRKERLL